jgi:hypothetical protein
MTVPSEPTSQPEPVDAELVPLTPAVPVTPVTVPRPDYTPDGVPTLDYVRDRIEGRYATSLGGAELAEAGPEARTIEHQEAERARAAQARLDEIRRGLRG